MITCGNCVHPQHEHDPHSGDCAVLHCGCHWTPPTREYPILLQTDYDTLREKIVCAECSAVIDVDRPYQDRLVGMMDDHVVTEIICVYC